MNKLYGRLLVSQLRPFHTTCDFLGTTVAAVVDVLVGNGRFAPHAVSGNGRCPCCKFVDWKRPFRIDDGLCVEGTAVSY